MFDYLLVHGQSFALPNCIHVFAGTIFIVCLFAKMEDFFLGARNPEGIHIQDLQEEKERRETTK